MNNREQFEAWLTSLPGFELADVEKVDDGKYSYSETEWCWKSWQASREAIELDIDWPEANDDYWKDGEEGAYARGHEDGKDKAALAVRKALADAGIKVNP